MDSTPGSASRRSERRSKKAILSSVVRSCRGQVREAHQDVGGVDAHVGVVDLEKAADYHARAGKQHDGQRHFPRDQDGGEVFSRPLPVRPGTDPRPPSFSVELTSSFDKRSAGARPNRMPVPMEIAMR